MITQPEFNAYGEITGGGENVPITSISEANSSTRAGVDLGGEESDLGLENLFVGSYGIKYDPKTDLHYMRFRWYSADQMRFLSPDLLLDINRYAYCEGDPINYTDIFGLKKTRRDVVIMRMHIIVDKRQGKEVAAGITKGWVCVMFPYTLWGNLMERDVKNAIRKEMGKKLSEKGTPLRWAYTQGGTNYLNDDPLNGWKFVPVQHAYMKQCKGTKKFKDTLPGDLAFKKYSKGKEFEHIGVVYETPSITNLGMGVVIPKQKMIAHFHGRVDCGGGVEAWTYEDFKGDGEVEFGRLPGFDEEIP